VGWSPAAGCRVQIEGSEALGTCEPPRPRRHVWLGQHGCTHLTVDESQVPALPFRPESFDAALLIGVLDLLTEPYLAGRQLRRILRPGGVRLVTTANDCYWRRRLDRVLPAKAAAPAGRAP